MRHNIIGRYLIAILVLVSLFCLLGNKAQAMAEGEGGGSGRTPWIIVILAAVWMVTLSAILISYFRIKKRGETEEERKSKETD